MIQVLLTIVRSEQLPGKKKNDIKCKRVRKGNREDGENNHLQV